ncbi:hypothetical protein MVLG_07249 [Microbotryum lychnidis-dioicae p1A1 Lamole]|uniref:C3H1-type domain-containing protein n=1 Tax=Microbotryum lychnidis-dioicae (strain p1A1 Lamole / MvSl-1064) TaxID=683840 RepID=U5HJS1_USTV1|nr:hypothetical protein MVLG_07249 [Microbotryum lychnidis-dioicae p1A1 Lamole]|eukprot:KDE02180.1 hypothetical protein MVLG_07249 [Microbotryum lychnidis-dioicae p1A1 Lamole]
MSPTQDRDKAARMYEQTLAIPPTAYSELPDYVLKRRDKEDMYKEALTFHRSHVYRLDKQAATLKKNHGLKLDVIEIMKVLTGQFVSAVDADNPAPSDLFYMFQHSSGSKFYGIEAMIQSKASLPKKTLSYAGHTEALMELERLEGVVFNYHQGRDWKHYTRFLRELAKDSQLGFDFMVLYDDEYRKQLADPDKSVHSLLDAHLGDSVYAKLISRWLAQTTPFRNEGPPAANRGSSSHSRQGSIPPKKKRNNACKRFNRGENHIEEDCLYRHICSSCKGGHAANSAVCLNRHLQHGGRLVVAAAGSAAGSASRQ